jgi:hypothetical protein
VANIAGSVDWRSSTPTGTLQFTNFTVAAGSTLIVPSGTVIRATGNVTISGLIQVATSQYAAMGMAAVSAAGCDNPNPPVSDNQPEPGGTGLDSVTYPLIAKLLVSPGVVGGGVGGCTSISYGGNGGGNVVILAAGSITINSGGSINADGLAGLGGAYDGGDCWAYSGGGGGGGIIVLASRTSITNSGTLSAQGGTGGNAGTNASPSGGVSNAAGGGGGGGIINLLAPSISAGTTRVGGGAAGNPGSGGNGWAGGGGGSWGDGGNTSDWGAPTAGGDGIVFKTTTVQDPSTLFVPAAHVN